MNHMVLSAVPGLSVKLAERLTAHFGSEQAVLSTMEAGDIGKLAEVDGLSPQRALKLAQQFAGGDHDFLATKEAVVQHQKLIDHIKQHSSCQAVKERIAVFAPIRDFSGRRTKIEQAMMLDLEWLLECQQMWSRITRLKDVNQRYERVIVTQSPKDHLKHYCRVLVPDGKETWKDYTVFKSVTWVGSGAPLESPDGWLILPEHASEDLYIPERIVDWFVTNRPTLDVLVQTLAQREESLWQNHPLLVEVLKALTPLQSLEPWMNALHDKHDIAAVEAIKDQLWKTIKQLELDVNQHVEQAMNDAKLALTGAELLEALADSSAFQRRLNDATSDVIQEAMVSARESFAAFLQPSGLKCPYDIFAHSWPAKIDKEIIDGIDAALASKLKAQETEHLVKAAKALAPLKTACELAVNTLIECDQWFTIARWAHINRCVMPTITKHGINLQHGRHILLGCEPDEVTYGLGRCAPSGDQQSIALLTGANSGGKTTLLELLAHVVILSHMGLPVPAASASVGHVESLHILAKSGGTQSAGALEQTLIQLASVVSDSSAKVILADELEAITEPGAGARIIAGMIAAAEAQSNMTMVLVTHLAPAILEAAGHREWRVDGIEAKGLDEHLELIVDRTPQRNHLARSTPELIVKRLVEKSQGDAQHVFKDILRLFH